MKTFKFTKFTIEVAKKALPVLAIVVGILGSFPSIVLATTETFTTSGSWTVPIGVTSVDVETWGGGGGGGGRGNSSGGSGGGGGGAYAKTTGISVTAGNVISYTVGSGGSGSSTLGDGTAGGDTIWGNNVVVANGGSPGLATQTGGAGGSTANSTGATKFSGGNGSTKSSNSSPGGGGGGGAGSTGNGNNATANSATAGAAKTVNGGAGGAGGSNASGSAGSNYGGGGGGGGRTSGSNKNGGDGAPGLIVITYTINTVTNLGNGTDGGNSAIGPGGSATEVDRFSLQTSTGSDTVTGLTVTLGGGTNAYQNVQTVDVQTTGGVSKCSATPSSDTVSLTSCGIAVTTTLTEYKILITPKSHANMPAVPGASYDVTATVTNWTGTNTHSGSDTGSATVTIDNLSPGDVTSASVSAGDTLNTLSWTNPGDSDLATVMVVASTSAITFTPVEGTTYSTTTLTGASRVACYGLQSSCTDSSLSNGTAYYYKIFTLDSHGNWSAGTVPTGSPATPQTSSYTEQAYKFFKASSADSDVSSWTSRTSSADRFWNSVTYGNGTFVAVSGGSEGAASEVMTSPDGVTWTTRAAAADSPWTSVTYGDGIFVAVSAGGAVMTSPDGITWTSRTAAAANTWRSITYGNGTFVAVSVDGTGNRVMTSATGTTWTSQSTSGKDSQWESVTYGNGTFVAVSRGNEGVGSEVMTSTDGVTWTLRTAAANNTWRDVTYGNGLFVAVSNTGTGNRVMTSPDGVTWTSQTSAADSSWLRLTYGNGQFVAVSASGVTNSIMTSTDGITWSLQSAPNTNALEDVVYGNGMFVAVSLNGTGNRVTTSGTFGPHPGLELAATSTAATLSYPGQAFRLRLLNRVDTANLAANSGKSFKLQYAQKSGTCDTSFSGETYADITDSTPIAYYDNADYNNGDVAIATSSDPIDTGRTVRYEEYAENNNFTNPTAIAAGEDGLWDFSLIDNGAPASTSYCLRAVKSTDAQTWTGKTVSEANQWRGAAYGNGTFVVVAQSGTHRVMTSTDGGATWSPQTAAAANSWHSVAYGNGTFVAVATDGTTADDVMRSTDGVTWTSSSLSGVPAANAWDSITYGNGLFVAVSLTGVAGTRVMTSPDGITWTARSSPLSGWNGVTYGNGQFVAVAESGTSQVMTSPDGINWTGQSAANTSFWNSVTYGNGLYVAVANAGTNMIMTSPDGYTWTAHASVDESGSWESVTYGNGLFAAVSFLGSSYIMTSPDGITWTARTAPASSNWYPITYGNGVFVAARSGNTDFMISSLSSSNLDTYTVIPEIQTASPAAATTAVGDATDSSNVTIAPGAAATTTDAFTLQTTSGTDAVTAVTVSLGSGAHNGIQYVEITDSAGNFVYGTSTTPASDTPSITTTNLTANTTLTTYKIRITPLSHANMPAPAGATYTVTASTTAITSTNSKTYADVAGTTLTIDNLSPSNVTSATVTAGDGQNSLSWTNPGDSDLSKVMVLRSLSAISDTPVEGSTYATSSTIGATTVTCYGNQSSCIDTGLLTQGATYYYKIYTTDTNGNWSANGTTPTGSPASTATSTYTQQAYKFYQATSSFDGVNWTARSAAEANSWQSITYGSSTFVAVSSDGTHRVMSSTDGTSWTAQTAASASFWNSVTFGNSTFVAVGNSGAVMTSSDGVSWTSRTAAEANGWVSVAYGSVTNGTSTFVAVTGSGTHEVMTSPDGITWTAQTAASNSNWRAVAYGNGIFVAINDTGGTASMMSSPDGITWTARSLDANPNGISLAYITYGGGKFVTAGNGTDVWTSADGITWTRQASALGAGPSALGYGNGQFIATRYLNSTIYTSSDGVIWTSHTVPEANGWNGIAYGNGLFAAVADSGTNRVMTSGYFGPHPGDAMAATSTAVTLFASGQQFHLRMLNRVDTVGLNATSGVSFKLQYAVKSGTCDAAFSGETYADITATTPISWYDNPAFHNRDAIFSTTTDPVDGSRTVKYQTYVEDNNFSNSSTTIASGQDGIWDLSLYDNGATGSTSYCIRAVKSTDAQTWTSRTNPIEGFGNLFDVAYGNGVYVAVSESQSDTGHDVISSSDGINWSARTMPDNLIFSGAAYGNGTFVISAWGANAYTSSDGSTWTRQTAATNSDWNAVTYGNGLFVAVAQSGSGNRVMTSPDGSLWTSRTSAADNAWISVTYGNGMFVALACGTSTTCNTTSGTRVMTSPDGINWTARTSAGDSTRWSKVTYGNGLFVAVGNGGAIMTSPDGITWTSRTSGTGTDLFGVTYGNGLFVAVGGSATPAVVLTSPDGVTWTQQTGGLSGSGIYGGVTYGNGVYVAVGTTGIITASSSASTFSSYGSGAESSGYLYSRTITIDHTKVGTVNNTDQSNFPVWVNGVYSYLATEANGGKVKDSNGYDVGFFSDSSCSTALSWETEKYTASNGKVSYWVKVPTVSHSTDTTIYMCYGNSSISTDQSSKTSVWSGNYDEVWHVPDTGLFLNDSTSNGQLLTNHNSVASLTDGGAGFNTANYLDNSTASVGNYTTGDFSVSYWAYYNSFNSGVVGQGPVTVFKGQYQTDGWYVQTNSDGTVVLTTSQSGANQFSSSGAGAVSTGGWYYHTFTRNGSSVRVYINGVDVTSTAGTHTNPTSSSENMTWGAYAPGTSSVKFDGNLDEMRLSPTKLTADWIKTEYNNQSSTSTFYSIGSEGTPSGSGTAIAEVLTAPSNNNPNIVELHYRWRNDDGNEVGATFAAGEDTTLSDNVYVGDRKRVRFVVSNTGSGSASSITYRLEQASSSCTSWMAVPTSETNGTHWAMDLSPYILDGSATTQISGLTAPNGKTFAAGYVKSSGNTTSAHTITSSQFTELEYTVRSTSNVSAGTTYCFRVTNGGSTSNFTYTVTPQIVITPNVRRPVGGGNNAGGEGNGSGPVVPGGNNGGGGTGGTGGSGSGGTQGGGTSGGGGGDTGFLFLKNIYVLFRGLESPVIIDPHFTLRR